MTNLELAIERYEQTNGPVIEANADAITNAILPISGVNRPWARRIVIAVARYGEGAANFAQLSGPDKHHWRHKRNF